jgi:hypothetical protein
MSTMRVLALTFGECSQGSTLYRVHQYQAPLEREGIRLELVPAARFTAWSSLNDYDAVLVQKRLFNLSRVRQLRARARRLVYDIDDALWEPHGRPHAFFTRWRTRLRLRAVVRAADVCLTANQVLAQHVRQWSSRVTVLPMALDENCWPPRGDAAAGRALPLRIGWAGAPVNLPYVEALEAELLAVRQQFPSVEVAVFSGAAPNFCDLPVRHLPFVAGTESEAIRSFDIGLLPLPDNAFAAGKSPIKALQYLASGAPVVASPVGATRELLHAGSTALFAVPGAWTPAMLRLLREPALRQQLGRQARAEFERRYTLRQTTPQFVAILRNLSSPATARSQ